MPKKSSKDLGEGKKRRSSSVKDTRIAQSNSAIEDVLLPPTPTATHLVATNPFDDPPSNNINTSSTFQGPMRVLVHSAVPGMASPSYTSIGSQMPQPLWKSPSGIPLHGPGRPYESPNHGWRPNSGEMVPGMMHGGPHYQNDPSIGPPSEYNNGHGMNKHSLYCTPPALNSSEAHMTKGPNHLRIPTHPGHQMTPPGPSYVQKSSIGRKSDKRELYDWAPKSKKRLKSSEVQQAVKSSNIGQQDKSWQSDVPKTSSVSCSLPPGRGTLMAPHAVPPVLPQTCFQCGKEIKHPAEDCVCCLASCHMWYHRSCTGLTYAAYECLKGEELALWACDNCLYTKEIGSVRLRNAPVGSPPTNSGDCVLVSAIA